MSNVVEIRYEDDEQVVFQFVADEVRSMELQWADWAFVVTFKTGETYTYSAADKDDLVETFNEVRQQVFDGWPSSASIIDDELTDAQKEDLLDALADLKIESQTVSGRDSVGVKIGD